MIWPFSLLLGPRVRTGVLEKIDLTWGGDGNQVMTISGYEYATWVDYQAWPKVGETVRFTVYKSRSKYGNTLRCANLLQPEKS